MFSMTGVAGMQAAEAGNALCGAVGMGMDRQYGPVRWKCSRLPFSS